VIFVDTGAWLARTVPTGAHHLAIGQWLRSNRQPLVTTDDHHFRQFGSVIVVP
jgi:predicted nucleic acid-binding protein